MAQVFLVHDVNLGREVALKTILTDKAGSATFKQRFRLEAKTCSKISHPNVISVLDYGSTEAGDLFYTMEYLPYPTLRELLDDKRRLDENKACALIRQLALALSACHKFGVVHRDIKSSNILIKDDEQLILADFGLVRCQGGTRITATGGLVGTPLYLPPEAVTEVDVDCRADIYQMGVVFHEMLTGRELIDDVSTMSELLIRIASPDFNPAAHVSKALSQKCKAILAKALQRDKELRFQSADEFIEVLDGARKLPDVTTEYAKVARTKKLKAKAAATASIKYSWMYLLLPLSLVVFLATYFLGTQQLVVEKSWSVKNIEIEVREKGVRLSWFSDSPYRSVVRVYGRGFDYTSNASSVTTKTHNVEIHGLAANTTYQASVVFPSGESSMARTFKTALPSMTRDSKENFTDCLEELLHSPRENSGRRLVASIKGKNVTFCIEPLSEAIALNYCSRLSKYENSMEMTMKKSALVFKALLGATLAVAERVPREDSTGRFMGLFVNSVNYLRDFRHTEDRYRAKRKNKRRFSLTNLGVAGRAAYFRLNSECEKNLSNWLKKNEFIPLPLELLYYQILSDALLLGRAEIQVREFRKRLIGKGLKGHDYDLLKAFAMYVEATSVFKAGETEKPMKAIDEMLLTADTFSKNWEEDPHRLLLWSVTQTFGDTVNHLLKSKKEITVERIFEKIIKVIRYYRKTELIEVLQRRLTSSKRMTQKERKRLKKLVNAALQGK